ncbi:MAG: phospholipase D-like domain-containing protein [Planctomycetota bacterium]|nr:phospholipase D-like domain-containing protein [Planctomycetota bacterium]
MTDSPSFDEILERTLDDGQISRSEERALRWVVRDLAPDAQQRGVLRSRVYALAEKRLGHDGRAVLDWVRKALSAIDRGEAAADPFIADFAFSPGEACLNKIRGLFTSSRTSVDVCVFTITDDRLASAIIEAHGRGVAVRVVTDDQKASDRGSDIDRIIDSGVPVRMDRSEHHMHHKFAVFDARTLLTGSYNWTRSAARENEENVLILTERSVVGGFSRVFEDLWKRFG